MDYTYTTSTPITVGGEQTAAGNSGGLAQLQAGAPNCPYCTPRCPHGYPLYPAPNVQPYRIDVVPYYPQYPYWGTPWGWWLPYVYY